MDAKSNEITAIPKVLDLLDLENKVITIDVMGAQREICQKIVDAKGTLYENVKLSLEDAKNHEMTNENNDKGHGDLERRVAAIANAIAWVEWPGLKAIAQITATVWRKGKETREIRYYISSLALDASRLNNVARRH